MKPVFARAMFLGVLSAALVLAGCGGGGSDGGTSGLTYSGSTTPVAIDVTNAENLSVATAEGAAEGVGANNADDANPFGVSISTGGSISPNELAEQVIKIGKIVQSEYVGSDLPVGLTLSAGQLGDPNMCGGTVTVPDNYTPGGLLNLTMTVTDLCFDDGSDPLMPVVLNGTMVFTETSTSISIEYRNLNIVNSAGESITVNSAVACDTTGVLTCTAYALYTGTDGAVYKIEDFTVSGDNGAGYQVEATFYHPAYGQIDIATPVALTFNCTNGKPDSGTINLTGSGGTSATITFTGCTSYTGTWNDGVSVGNFGGNWL